MYQQLPQDCESRYEAGETLRQLAAFYQMSEETLRRRMKAAGITLRPRGTPVGKRRPRGGVIKDRDGYLLERVPDHPNANATGYVRQHRLVMERALGRYLTGEEIVSHVNGHKDDNRIENLQLFASSADEKRASLMGNSFSKGDVDNPKRRIRRRRSRGEILRALALLQGTLQRPIRRADLQPPNPSYRAVARAFGCWRCGVAEAVRRYPSLAQPDGFRYAA